MVGAVCLLLSSTVYAEDLKSTDANIVGHVIEKSTREHLPYMTVSLKGTTIGTMTDATGHYFLKNLPEGEFTLSVSAVGYKSQERKVVLKRGKTLEENFELEEDMVALDGPNPVRPDYSGHITVAGLMDNSLVKIKIGRASCRERV